MVKSTIKAGVCGFTTVVTAESDDMQNVSFNIESDCQNVMGFAEILPVIDGYQEIGAGYDGEIYKAVRANLKGCCAGCAVPCGVFKAMQVAAGLALPSPVSIDMERQ